MTAITIALDWTPNGNHVGFYVAKAKGLYDAAGLAVTLLSPHRDAYKATPASKVASGTATFAVTPSETVISHATWPSGSPDPKPRLVAVAALLQRDDSAIVTLSSSGIDTPAKLEGKRYASYGARYEGRIVQQMIKNAGGSGAYQEIAAPMLGLWDSVVTGAADATWIFCGWEGVEAARRGITLNSFRLSDWAIPYGYSPVLVTTPDVLASKETEVRAFLAATAEGYRYAVAHPEEAGALLHSVASAENPDLPTPLDKDLCVGSVKSLSDAYIAKDGRWGIMSAEKWDAFLDWLSVSGLLTTKVQSRTPQEGVSTSLDGLRAGDGGDVVPRDSVSSADLFTSRFL